MIEEAIGVKYPEQKMRCPVHLSIGQEAITVGVCKNLLKEDHLISNHRANEFMTELRKQQSEKPLLEVLDRSFTGPFCGDCTWE